MSRDLVAFIADVLGDMRTGICPACRGVLPPRDQRAYSFTCTEACHAKWIDDVVAKVGPTKAITYAPTGKVYLVSTRDILETGVKGSDVPTYPEATP